MAKGTCSFPDCGGILDAAGLCSSHYSQKRLGRPLTALRKVVPNRVCDFPECGQPHSARGLCSSHYIQQYTGKPLTPVARHTRDPELVEPGSERACRFEGCRRVQYAKGLCSAHRQQARKGKTLTPVRERRPCTFEGCDRDGKARGLCGSHSRQLAKTGELKPLRVKTGPARVMSGGYVRVWAPDHPNAQSRGWIPEHVKVMSDHLGRPLAPGENVHHRNGVKTDNGLENLELWVSSQPSGQRAEDLVAWAREVLTRYEHLF